MTMLSCAASLIAAAGAQHPLAPQQGAKGPPGYLPNQSCTKELLATLTQAFAKACCANAQAIAKATSEAISKQVSTATAKGTQPRPLQDHAPCMPLLSPAIRC